MTSTMFIITVKPQGTPKCVCFAASKVQPSSFTAKNFETLENWDWFVTSVGEVKW